MTIDPQSIRNLSIPQTSQLIACHTGLNSIGGNSHMECMSDFQEIATNEGTFKPFEFKIIILTVSVFHRIGICYTFNLLDSEQMFKDNV